MKFVFGVALGAVGFWAYRSGKLQGLMGGAPEQVWQPAVERFGQVANSDQVRQVASKVQDKVQETTQQARTPEIATPTASEVSGRPSDPLPTPGA